MIAAPAGESLHFVCPVGRIPVLDELETRMWVKANRPGVALAAARRAAAIGRCGDRRRKDSARLRSSNAMQADRWQQLTLADVPKPAR